MQLKYLPGGEFIGINAGIKLEERSQTNNLIFYLKTIKEKNRKLKLKLADRRINKNGAEINETKTEKKNQ